MVWKAETGVMQLHITEEAFFKEPHTTGNTFSPKTSGGNMTLPTPSFWSCDTDFGLLASRTMKVEIVWLSTTKFILTCCSTHRKLIQEGCASASGETPSCLRMSLGP